MKSENEKPLSREEAVPEMAVDFWKLLRVSERILASLPEERRTRLSAQIRFSAGRLSQHLDALDIRLATFEGQKFGPELPAIAINAEDIEEGQEPLIESAVEPAVIWKGRVIQNARVVLKGSDADVSGN
ncbi:MAG: hypothetical protein GW858_10720 [Sphingomonadales bacterium]|nr:hypothetical protein [Sphingomonadales bacterium]